MLLAWTTRALFESRSSTAPWNQVNATSSDATGDGHACEGRWRRPN